jgi:hypothetical protein
MEWTIDDGSELFGSDPLLLPLLLHVVCKDFVALCFEGNNQTGYKDIKSTGFSLCGV